MGQSTFDPAVTVSALSLDNLSKIPYSRYTLCSPPSPGAVLDRAKWLDSGSPPHLSLPAAALSLLAEHLPSALATCLNVSRTKTRNPVVYVFGTQHTQLAAANLLHPTFASDASGIWQPNEDGMATVTSALLSSIHRAINYSLQAVGAVRMSSTLIMPHLNLSYTFAVSLGRGANPHVLVRVAVKRSNLRRVTDQDTAAAMGQAIPVQAGPMEVMGVLSPRPVAGDSLSASVIARWKEAGLLPSGELKDSTVLFVTISGVDVPFPRMVVLTSHPLKSLTPDSPQKPVEKPQKKLSSPSLWRSRKRPRSPSQIEEAKSSLPTHRMPSQGQTQPTPVVSEKAFNDAPTAQNLNAAIQEQGGLNDPVPVLRHPFINAQAPLYSPKANTENVKNEPRNEWDADAPKPQTNTVVKEEAQQIPVQPPQATPVKAESTDSNAIESFLQDSNPQDGFDTGPGMDMADFGAIEDEFTEYFNDGMDDRIQPVENDLLQEDVTLKTEEIVQPAEEAPQNANQTEDATMDVDSGNKITSAATDQSVGLKGNPSPLDVVKFALDALRKPIPSKRPPRDTVKSQLSSFYERDLSERRQKSLSLSANRTIVKRKMKGGAFKGKYSVAQIVDDFLQSGSTNNPASTTNEAYISGQSPPIVIVEPVKDALKKDNGTTYVPRRKIRAYRKLRKSGVDVAISALLHTDSDSEWGDSDDENASPHSVRPKSKNNFAPGGFLPAHLTANTPLNEMNQPIPNLSTADLVETLSQPPTDPRKIVESVAVDCASACVILAVDKNYEIHNIFTAEDRGGVTGHVQEPACSPTGIREEDIKATPNVSVSGHTVGKPILQHPGPKSLVSGVISSPPSRVSAKQSREFFTLLSLLEMQLFSMPELSIFGDSERVDPYEAMLKKQKISHEKEARQVSSATMRRVLLGLPRALETSSVFGSCFNSFQEENSDLPLPSVRGPLSVNEFLGGDATVFPLESPRVCVGYNKEWIEASSGALPLWEKAGFEPYSEKKNVEYVAVAPKDMEEDVRIFLRDVSAAYEECLFGKHTPMIKDPLMSISNSQSKPVSADKSVKSPHLLSDVDRSMAEQFHLTVNGLCTKLTHVTREYRKNPSRSPANIVAYIVSPFPKSSTAANVALMKAVAPLVAAIPGTVPSLALTNSHLPNLPAAPWRNSASSKGIISVTVRVIPREVVDRKLPGRTEVDQLLKRPMRPQLMKAVSFAVFNSIRFKRVRNPSMDGEIFSVLSKASLMPDDLMSPMTPDMVAESPGGNTPVSPIGPSVEESTGQHGPGGGIGGSLMDQSSALSPSFLHEPVLVLAGVGKHMGQTSGRSNIVLHLAYAYCASSSRYVFSWTDQRGEMLDTATVPVSKSCITASRRKAFWGMWARGKRWRISYVQEVNSTISKLGSMSDAEIEDWEWVIRKVTTFRSSNGEKKAEEESPKLVRRFPPLQPQRNDDSLEAYTDVPTPATPGNSQPMSSVGAKNQISMDIKMPPVCSVTLLSVCNADTHLFMEKSGDDSSDRRDFAVISDTSLAKERNVQANATLARFDDDGISAIEVNILRHFGRVEEREEMSDDKSPWDANDVQVIANTIAVNFHDLRYVSSPPSWPHKRWLSMYPIHLDTVRSFQANLKHILSCPVSPAQNTNR